MPTRIKGYTIDDIRECALFWVFDTYEDDKYLKLLGLLYTALDLAPDPDEIYRLFDRVRELVERGSK
jgi:hypothetical protein